jgi:RNA polymerase sigma-70 factor, ECF subfamily
MPRTPVDQQAQRQEGTEPSGCVGTVTSGGVCASGQDDGDRMASPSTADPAGTVEPFEAFMRREWNLVVGLLYGLTRDWFAAEDLTQNAFAAAQRDWIRIGRLDKPGAWVRKVAVNGQRRWRRRGALEARALAQRFLHVYPEQVELPAEHAELWDAVWRLPRGQREVFVLHHQSDLSVAEVAELLRIREGTVKSRLHYGRKTLAKWLGDDVEGGSP